MDNFALLDGILLACALLIAFVMFQRGIREAPFWRATVTPLASIIGSGFLVVVPLLASIAGTLASYAIMGIVLLSFWLGSALRFNIQHDGQTRLAENRRVAQTLERLSELALAFAYVISVTFYIRLMGGFVLTGLDAYSGFHADMLASLVLLCIGIYGFWRGLHGLELLEEYSVTIKLAIIASLLLGLAYFDVAQGYDLSALPTPQNDLWEGLRSLAGMLLIVQGFETSKYLVSEYGSQTSIRSMRLAQWVAGVIYVAFVILAMPLMAPYASQTPNEAAIIALSGEVAFVLPLMLVLAATMSQFSASVADTIGAGGVIEAETNKRLPARYSYLLIAGLAIALIWTSNIFEIVALASRAFAFYYLLQALLATYLATKTHSGWKRVGLITFYAVLALVLLAIVLFAKPVEG